MLISNNRTPSLEEFIKLVKRAALNMNDEIKDNTSLLRYYRSRNGTKFEEDVYRVLVKEAVGTNFEGTIQLVSNRSFPDIVASNYYGVEVKTSKKGWKSVGSSIMESSRVKGVDHILMFFGKLDSEVEFRVRTYQECLSDIVVTHSPRYSIDMELHNGDTIFEKMETNYDSFRKMEHPVEVVKEYYRSKLSEGQDLWWMTKDDVETQGLSPVVKLWNTLDSVERKYFKVQGFCWFPEIFSGSPTKYNRFAIWLTTNHGVIPTALRDIYSAGGQENLIINGQVWESQPRIIYELAASKDDVKEAILSAEEELVQEMWGIPSILSGDERLKQWINQISQYNFGFKELLYNLFELEDNLQN